MTTVSLSPPPKLQFFGTDGNPLANGKVYTYAAGTTTPLTTYYDSTGTAANTNPIILDTRGEANIWLDASAYKFVLKTSTDTLIWTVDNITSSAYLKAYIDAALATALAAVAALKADLANTTEVIKGDALIGFRQSNSSGALANAVGRTVHQKLQETVSVKDFGAAGDGLTDDTAAIQSAITASAGGELYFPPGTYLVSAPINVPANISIIGAVKQSVIKIKSGTYTANNVSIFLMNTVYNVYVYGIDFNGNKGNIGSTHNPINTIYNTGNVCFDTCRYLSCEGICLNVSSGNAVQVLNCQFFYCGGATDNSDGYRNQGIAFSGTNNLAAKIIGCYFYAQGLDCISMSYNNDIIVSNNIAEDSYTFLFNAANAATSKNITVTGNVIRNTNQGTLISAVNPVAIDLPYVENVSIVGNSIYRCAQSGIGIFEGSGNVVVDGNVLFDCGTSPVSWTGAISVGGGAGTASNIGSVLITDNTIVSTTSPLMLFGILISDDVTDVTISENNIVNWATSKYGYYLHTTVPTVANTYALTTNANISATTLINDFDAYDQAITNWRKVNTLTGYYFNGTKVVGAQQGAIANSGDATVNSILAALRTHGLIAT